MLFELFENLRIAMVSLTSNKLRAGLTMLGIIIGVAAVVVLLSLGQGVQAYITNQFNSLGANTIRVFATRTADGKRATLTLADATALDNPDRLPDVRVVMPQTQGSYPAVYGGNAFNVGTQGATTAFLEVDNRQVTEGRFFTEAEYVDSARVAIIGVETSQNLFGGVDPVGKNIRISDVIFEVIGVFNDTGGLNDDLIVIPLTAAQTRLSGARTPTGEYVISTISVLAVDNEHVQTAVDEVTRVLHDERGLAAGQEDDFRVFSASTILTSLTDIIGTFTLFLGVIAGISLLVGGIGVMNIMLVTVNERTREVGLRKAVGAQNMDIVLQFLIEAVVITLFGGFIGILLALAATTIISALVADFTAVVQLSSVALAIFISASVGIFFGVYPARRASQLNPIDALRYE